VRDAALELVNSGERLRDRTWLRAAAARWGVPLDRLPTSGEIAELERLRDLLRRLAGTVASGRQLSPRDLAELNAVLGRAPVRARIVAEPDGGYAVEMTPVAAGWRELAVRELAGSFGSLLRRSRPPHRLKLCANPECRAAFWDESRNRTRRWCDPSGCGNRARVRRHRALRSRRGRDDDRPA
jgi:predicted RNA-binding Zn ribbon-like protein